jgi:hypothetical protein
MLEEAYTTRLAGTRRAYRCFLIFKSSRIAHFSHRDEFQNYACATVCGYQRALHHITNRNARYDARDNKLHLNHVPIPEPREHELLVKIKNASLCHSDVMLFEPNDQGLILLVNSRSIHQETISHRQPEARIPSPLGTKPPGPLLAAGRARRRINLMSTTMLGFYAPSNAALIV